ncbi:hypothetical protein L0668_11070 [Paraglaciecola aquimarina]|uniref:Phytanoyl-CoA dioxygenase n=1 Tax=Paraglaciecola algarum TaxID=3050085 RepID=A0ABS9D7H7_9ALTE|nr:hypothetical protein [Paraglaciecola sp. G1-23]MCF2948649.1 hypothetical protein [Paraglaciecola sp. G1-23]
MINDTDIEELKQLTSILLDPNNSVYRLRPEVLALTDLFNHSSQFTFDIANDISDGESLTSDGLAVSPKMAAMCVDDYIRTIMFIRGLNAAIIEKLNVISSRPIHVLYVGCGPFAAQAVPLMTKFTASEVQFTLLDIHNRSLSCVKNVINHFNLASSVCDIINTDAANYVIQADAKPDVIVMEIMQNCLHKEPQVTVSRNLVIQAPSATLVPQSIRIELALINTQNDLAHNQESDSPLSHKVLGEVFCLSKSSILNWQKQPSSNVLTGNKVTIQGPIEQGFQPMLKTQVTIFKEHQISNYDSGLTTPIPLSEYSNAKVDENVQFSYTLGVCPTLVAKVTS